MSESNEATTTTEEPEVYEPKTAAEEKAMDRGWVPEHLFSGEKEDWVDAKEFNYRGQLMDEISKRTRHNKKLEETVHKFKVYMDNMEQKAYERAKEELLIAKAEALMREIPLKQYRKMKSLNSLTNRSINPQLFNQMWMNGIQSMISGSRITLGTNQIRLWQHMPTQLFQNMYNNILTVHQEKLMLMFLRK